jgi:hypothetical protein
LISHQCGFSLPPALLLAENFRRPPGPPGQKQLDFTQPGGPVLPPSVGAIILIAKPHQFYLFLFANHVRRHGRERKRAAGFIFYFLSDSKCDFFKCRVLPDPTRQWNLILYLFCCPQKEGKKGGLACGSARRPI